MTTLVLAGVATGAVGFPVTPGGLGGAFPCHGGGCGCRSAADCWFGCCCLTPAQRLAWAKKRGVTPPAGLAELARNQAPPKPKRSCCAGYGNVRRKDTGARKSCCGGKAATKAERAEERRDDATPHFARSRCRGFGQHWVTLGQPLALPDKPPAMTGGDVRGLIVAASSGYSFLTSPPPTRPG